MKHLPHDPACKDASRVFYGSTEASFPLVQPNVTLPAEWVTEAIATAEREKLEYQQRIADIEKRNVELRDRAEFEGWDIDALIQQALSYIPPRQPGSGNYDECLKVLMALNSYYGAAEGQAIAERWSPSIKGTTWNVAAKFRSFRERNGISIGTLFHIAKQYGFKFPQNQQQFESEPKAYNQDGKLEKTVTREKWKSAYTFKQLLDLAPKLKERFSKKKQPWGFGKQPEEQGEQQQSPLITTPTHIYEKGDRKSTWINSPSKYIFDSSGTGSGKSYDAGSLQPSDFDCEKIFYISNDSRNPTTPTLQKDWAHLEGRHKGLIRDDKDKLRRKKDGGKGAAVPPNCARADTIQALATANIQSAYSANIACNNCAYLEACKGGHLFGYLNDRAKTFGNSRIISHPQSLPSPGEDFDYSDSVLIWEEWSELFKNFDEVQVTVRDVDMMIATLATDNFELLQQLQPLLTKIKSLLTKGEKAPTRYGWNFEHLKELLPIPESIDLAKVAEATVPDLSVLNPVKEYGEDIDNLPAGVRKKFQKRDNETADKVKQSVLKQWILPLLEILKGDCTGYISCDFNNLTITTPNSRLAGIAASAKKNIFLDATGRLIDLAQLLIIPYTQIFRCEQKADKPTNLEVIQVGGLGRMGISRGDDQQRRGEAVITELTNQCEEKGESYEVISFKKNGSKYQWFVDSRGSNDLEGVPNIILDGIPTPNLEALKAEFTCIHNRTPEAGTKAIKQPIEVTNQLPEGIHRYFDYEVSSDNDFADFLRHRILETINQAIGRNRSDRYPDNQFKVYVLGDYPLDTPV
ncbi:MAG: PriCT-2 domain-containing protein, partial [Cyanobacteria bacterium J06636_27]